jgi:hypothetical protein
MEIKKVSFDKEVEVVKMVIENFLPIPPCPQQRDTEGRAKKKATKKMLSKLHPSQLDVAIVELLQDCLYYGKKYKKGSQFIVNGNTRKYFWENGLSDAIPSYVNATIFKVKNMKEVENIYNTYDNPNATERNQEKLYGIIYRTYDYVAQSSKVEKGEFLTALQYACFCYDPLTYPIGSRDYDILPFKVKDFIEEIKAFDKICKSPKYWDQALICSALMLFKTYGTNNPKLNSFLSCIDSRSMDTSKAERDGATHVCWEWSTGEKWKDKRSNFETDGSLRYTVPFVLYWAEKYMQDKKQSQLGGGWDKMAEQWFDSYHKTNTSLSKALSVPVELEDLVR